MTQKQEKDGGELGLTRTRALPWANTMEEEMDDTRAAGVRTNVIVGTGNRI